MNTFKNVVLPVAFILLAQASYAEVGQTTVITSGQTTSWTSKSSADVVTINNGTGKKLTITINVDKPASPQANDTTWSPPGVNVNNCGDTKHIDAGSSAVCTTSDSLNPVNFSSDSNTIPASGKYNISQY